MISVMISSRIERRPLAPVFLSIASEATASSASLSNSSSAPSIPISFLYCLTREFFGSVRILIRASSSSESSPTITGSLPTSSGIRPNFTMSCGTISRNIFDFSFSSLVLISPTYPIVEPPLRFSMILSMVSNAPPQIKRIFFVSILMNSWLGCFLPPCGGTFATVPSRIFNRACCTPSPETSRVIERFSLQRAILSISSI